MKNGLTGKYLELFSNVLILKKYAIDERVNIVMSI